MHGGAAEGREGLSNLQRSSGNRGGREENERTRTSLIHTEARAIKARAGRREAPGARAHAESAADPTVALTSTPAGLASSGRIVGQDGKGGEAGGDRALYTAVQSPRFRGLVFLPLPTCPQNQYHTSLPTTRARRIFLRKARYTSHKPWTENSDFCEGDPNHLLSEMLSKHRICIVLTGLIRHYKTYEDRASPISNWLNPTTRLPPAPAQSRSQPPPVVPPLARVGVIVAAPGWQWLYTHLLPHVPSAALVTASPRRDQSRNPQPLASPRRGIQKEDGA
jgi:hypothetical protein